MSKIVLHNLDLDDDEVLEELGHDSTYQDHRRNAESRKNAGITSTHHKSLANGRYSQQAKSKCDKFAHLVSTETAKSKH